MTKKIVCKLTIGGAAITTASLVTSTVLLMTNKNNSCPNDENK
jgi:hypothetical protein